MGDLGFWAEHLKASANPSFVFFHCWSTAVAALQLIVALESTAGNHGYDFSLISGFLCLKRSGHLNLFGDYGERESNVDGIDAQVFLGIPCTRGVPLEERRRPGGRRESNFICCWCVLVNVLAFCLVRVNLLSIECSYIWFVSLSALVLLQTTARNLCRDCIFCSPVGLHLLTFWKKTSTLLF